jgi:hypothetical protein
VRPDHDNPPGAVKFQVNHVTVLTPPFDGFDKVMVVEFAIAVWRNCIAKASKGKKSQGRDREPGPRFTFWAESRCQRARNRF